MTIEIMMPVVMNRYKVRGETTLLHQKRNDTRKEKGNVRFLFTIMVYIFYWRGVVHVKTN